YLSSCSLAFSDTRVQSSKSTPPDLSIYMRRKWSFPSVTYSISESETPSCIKTGSIIVSISSNFCFKVEPPFVVYICFLSQDIHSYYALYCFIFYITLFDHHIESI